jgi:molybdate transport system substrate-binding protein
VPFSTEEDLRAALSAAARIAYSTGPSGTGLVDLIERWELGGVVQHKLVRAGPGTPVARLLAAGEADLGFQQRSEFSGVAGIRVLGPLPGAAAIRSTFSGALLARSTNKQPAREVLSFFGSKDAEEHVLAAGMALA